MSTYYIENFGCRATQADGAALGRQFETRGLTPACAAQADLVILNTCTVTKSADHDARAAIRRVHRENPTGKIVVTGCYAQRAPEEIAALPGVSCVIGNSHKHQLAEIVLGSRPSDLAPRTNPAPHGDPERRGDLLMHADFEWRSASSAVKNLALPERASAPEAPAFIPLATLTAQPQLSRTDNHELRTGSHIFVSDIFAHTELLAAPVYDVANDAGSHENDRARPNLKVQDGCDNRCSFCVIPYVRGQSRSLPLHRILKEVNALVAAGYREVVISGINLGRWGRDLAVSHQPPAMSARQDLGPPTSNIGRHASDRAISAAVEIRRSRPDGGALPRFEDLIRAILAETALEKLRISSVEPMDWTDELIALAASSPRIAKHAHVPLQSGSDAVLRRMHRKYRPWHYREKIEKIRTAMPTAAIGADVMAGFPGETEAEFESTRRLIEELPLTYLHVFTYSPRPGTPAAAMPNQVPVQLARERNRLLRDLAANKKKAFMQSFIGQTLEAITLKHSDERTSGLAFTEALTDNYLKLHLRGSYQPNRWLRSRVEDVADGALWGSESSASACDTWQL